MYKRADVNSPCQGLGGALIHVGVVCARVASGLFWRAVDKFSNMFYCGLALVDFASKRTTFFFQFSFLAEVTCWSMSGEVKICPSKQQPGQ